MPIVKYWQAPFGQVNGFSHICYSSGLSTAKFETHQTRNKRI